MIEKMIMLPILHKTDEEIKEEIIYKLMGIGGLFDDVYMSIIKMDSPSFRLLPPTVTYELLSVMQDYEKLLGKIIKL